jgi:vancomycin resistance protein VanW
LEPEVRVIVPWPVRTRPWQWHPALYHASVWQKRVVRAASWALDPRPYARVVATDPLPHRVFKHTSKLLRKVDDGLVHLQHGKVQNLRAALPHVHNVVLAPGEVFSFCRLVGPPLRSRGFVEGMELSRGVARPGVGGGLCQLSNLLHWLVLHSPLTVLERSHHGFDPFPDDGRVLPFGSGATVFWNYRDYVFRNETDATFQVRVWLTDHLLEGELRCDRAPRVKFHVFERNPRFFRREGKVYRANELWREVHLRGNPPVTLRTERLHANCAEVRYALGPEVVVHDGDPLAGGAP